MRFTAERQERTFVDAEGVTIHYAVWKASSPRAVIQIAHGLGEHLGRYETLAQEFVEAGYTVYADDHRGHGKTGVEQWGGDAARMGRLGPGGMRAAVAAVHRFTGIIRAENAGLPLALLGHSWGSLLAQVLVNQHSEDYDVLVLTGTAYRTLVHMNSGDLARRHRVPGGSGFEWLSRDPEVATRFAADPLTFVPNASKPFGIPDGLRLLGRPRRALPHDLPVLI